VTSNRKSQVGRSVVDRRKPDEWQASAANYRCQQSVMSVGLADQQQQRATHLYIIYHYRYTAHCITSRDIMSAQCRHCVWPSAYI